VDVERGVFEQGPPPAYKTHTHTHTHAHTHTHTHTHTRLFSHDAHEKHSVFEHDPPFMYRHKVVSLSYTQTQTHTNTQKRKHTHTNTQTDTQTYTNTHTHTYTYTHTLTHTHTHGYPAMTCMQSTAYSNKTHNLCIEIKLSVETKRIREELMCIMIPRIQLDLST